MIVDISTASDTVSILQDLHKFATFSSFIYVFIPMHGATGKHNNKKI